MDQVVLGWVVLEMTNSAWHVAIIGAIRWLPLLLFGLLGGAFADRVDRRRLLIGAQTLGLVGVACDRGAAGAGHLRLRAGGDRDVPARAAVGDRLADAARADPGPGRPGAHGQRRRARSGVDEPHADLRSAAGGRVDRLRQPGGGVPGHGWPVRGRNRLPDHHAAGGARPTGHQRPGAALPARRAVVAAQERADRGRAAHQHLHERARVSLSTVVAGVCARRPERGRDRVGHARRGGRDRFAARGRWSSPRRAGCRAPGCCSGSARA